MAVIRTPFSKLVSRAEEIGDLIDETTWDRLQTAGRYSAKIMRQNLGTRGASTPGGFPARRTGYLQKKTGYKFIKDPDNPNVIVGSKAPSAHLLEFGHGDGKTRNKRPFVNRSIDEATPGIIKILSDRYF